MAVNRDALDDKYSQDAGRIYISGVQALVRLALVQHRRDRAAGHHTAGYVSGYRGSPLGTVDAEYWRAEDITKAHHVHFQAGVNEDLAATAIWGTQQTNLSAGARYDGVYAMWYGKGPGVDRSGDPFRHANLAGTAPLGGVLAVAGDDPSCMSSTLASQSDLALIDAQFPLLVPATVQDILDFGVLGWALSRYSGCWVAMKTTSELMDSSASVDADIGRIQITIPKDAGMPGGGLHIRWPDGSLAQEERLARHKLPAVRAFVAANGFDRVVLDTPKARIGIVTGGKPYAEVMQALSDLGVDEKSARRMGLRLYKVGCAWPLEPDGLARFAKGLDEILVIEEKRPVIEPQIRDQLYGLADGARPRVLGKLDSDGAPLLPSYGVLSSAQITRVIAGRLEPYLKGGAAAKRLARLGQLQDAEAENDTGLRRAPYFCSGCPHNISTLVPSGSRALSGIGCHTMAIWMDRDTTTYTHMGGEGANWLGQAPFTDTAHVFANIGDGTYFHSGLMAIRAAVGAGVTMTYKVLYNDAVALTGGQPMDGPLDVPMITRQVRAEGVDRICVVSDEPGKYGGADFAKGVTVHHRDGLMDVQRGLRECPGVSVLVYDQTCAAEKRRRRKRGRLEDPPLRAFINEAVCEGCGDCGVKSNCVSIQPKETPLGRKRVIDQSSCNKDFSCLSGFCPSFVTVHGGWLRRRAGRAGGEAEFPDLPRPEPPATDAPYGIVVSGIGGTGVVTAGGILGMAAHLEGKGVNMLEITGMAQKNGAVFTHLRIADDPAAILGLRMNPGNAHLLIGCDLVTAAGAETLSALAPGAAHAVVNVHETMTADFTQSPDMEFPGPALRQSVTNAAGADNTRFIDATALAQALLGDTIATNLFMVGFAWQQGLVPLSEASIGRAIELNGVAVDFNRRAFQWGRRAAHDADAVGEIAGVATVTPAPAATTAPAAAPALDALVKPRIDALTRYQDAAYAGRYALLVDRARMAEEELGMDGLARAVAEGYFKLLAYKDEYEVARLYSDSAFAQSLRETFAGDYRLSFHLAPPFLAHATRPGDEPRTREFGGWVLPLFRVLARLKRLRGTPFDPFRFSADRRLERRLIRDYEATVRRILEGLTAANHATACEIAALPAAIRGFGPVKARAAAAAEARARELMAAFSTPPPARAAAHRAAE